MYLDFLDGKKLVRFGLLLTGGNVMDVDYFIDDVTLRSCPLDLNALRASESRLHIAVTDWDLGKQDGEAFVARYAVYSSR